MSIMMVGWLFTLNDGNFLKTKFIVGYIALKPPLILKHAGCKIDKVREQSHKLVMRLDSKVIEKIFFNNKIIAYFYSVFADLLIIESNK